MAFSRRIAGHPPKLSGRVWNDVARELEECLRTLLQAEDNGLPPGFSGVTPTTIEAGESGSAGTKTTGWAAGDHTHEIDTDAPVDLGEANAEGSGTALARAAHIHKLLVRIAKAGTTVGTRKRINLIEGPGVTLTVSDDSINDEIDVTVSAAASAGPVASQPSVNDYILHRAVHAEAYAYALATEKI